MARIELISRFETGSKDEGAGRSALVPPNAGANHAQRSSGIMTLICIELSIPALPFTITIDYCCAMTPDSQDNSVDSGAALDLDMEPLDGHAPSHSRLNTVHT